MYPCSHGVHRTFVSNYILTTALSRESVHNHQHVQPWNPTCFMVKPPFFMVEPIFFALITFGFLGLVHITWTYIVLQIPYVLTKDSRFLSLSQSTGEFTGTLSWDMEIHLCFPAKLIRKLWLIQVFLLCFLQWPKGMTKSRTGKVAGPLIASRWKICLLRRWT